VNEPPDLWQTRVPAKWKPRAPKVLRTDRGDVWSFDEGKRLRPLGLTATAGLSYLDYRPSGITYEEMRPGSFDTKARLADLDADGIYLQVLYPSVTLSGAKVYSSDPELQIACVRAYNDWLAEFCEGSDGRLIGQAILPTTGVDDCIAVVDIGQLELPALTLALWADQDASGVTGSQIAKPYISADSWQLETDANGTPDSLSFTASDAMGNIKTNTPPGVIHARSWQHLAATWDGSTQIVYAGHPLYEFAGDSNAGDANGEGAAGKWYVLDANGAVVDKS